jgi:hypothetical protein
VAFQADSHMNLPDFLQPHEVALIVFGCEEVCEPTLDRFLSLGNGFIGSEETGRVSVFQQKPVEIPGQLIGQGQQNATELPEVFFIL